MSKFQPFGTIFKNDLEILENGFFDLEKIEILKKIKTSFHVFKIPDLYHYFEKNDLENSEKRLFDLEKIRKNPNG